MNQVTYSVPNIMCEHCVHTIQREVGEIAGVKSVSAELKTKQVSIQFDAPATQEQLEATLAEINYPVKK
jgi:copper ion binding protein